MYRYACLVLCALLAACAATTPDELRAKPAVKKVLVLDENYQVVLKRLVKWDQECRGKPIVLIGHLYNDVEHYPDLRQATIARRSRRWDNVMEAVDLLEIAPGKTEMTVYAFYSSTQSPERRWRFNCASPPGTEAAEAKSAMSTLQGGTFSLRAPRHGGWPTMQDGGCGTW